MGRIPRWIRRENFDKRIIKRKPINNSIAQFSYRTLARERACLATVNHHRSTCKFSIEKRASNMCCCNCGIWVSKFLRHLTCRHTTGEHNFYFSIWIFHFVPFCCFHAINGRNIFRNFSFNHCELSRMGRCDFFFPVFFADS